ncbi:hypothetical protein [Glycomyces terrestris]|uniref:Uncharacterized protein n=1 Tax=Glycomyces terrestris TaxID=2493553 RepID=A0A426V0P1_9ACTN|nr:hypothetical protein [Glycomyces terrestris]RRS00422.1 hypothetical protein EIW28_07595 [Glycomyces terrestris]
MEPQDDTGALLRQARPDATPREAPLDLDSILRGGYRARRRHRALIGGAATAGVAAVAAVLAFSVGVFGLGDAPERRQEFPPGDPLGFDPAQAGYPGPAPDVWDERQPALDEALRSAFGDLAVDGGFLDADALDYERPADEEVQDRMDEGMGYYAALAELGYRDLPLQFGPWSSEATEAQVHLLGYVAGAGDGAPAVFEINALAPGGWTAEPGPTGTEAFPRHLISDEPSWTGEAPEFSTEELDDGRTLMVADHGCALDAAVVYPNGSALRSSWDLGCPDGAARELSVADLTEAMLAMPQIEYDTSALAPVGDVLDVPDGWPWDEGWEAEAAGDAAATFDAATNALGEHHPGIELLSSGPSQRGDEGGQVVHAFSGTYRLPYEDEEDIPVTAAVTYFLPGGWLPGLAPEGSGGAPYLVACGHSDKDDTCEEMEVAGRTVVTRTFGVGDSHSYGVLLYDPAGWAVELTSAYAGHVEGATFDDLVETVLSLPAPVYDPAAYAQD